MAFNRFLMLILNSIVVINKIQMFNSVIIRLELAYDQVNNFLFFIVHNKIKHYK